MIYPAQTDLLRSDDQPTRLVVLSNGLGQQSFATLCRLIHDPAFRARYVPDGARLISVTSDTGDEHADTLAHFHQVARPLAEAAGIDIVHITPDLGFHGGTWTGLVEHHLEKGTIGSATFGPFKKVCSMRLKVDVIYRWLGWYLYANYNTIEPSQKREYHDFADRYGRIDMLIGFGKGEEGRVADESKLPVYIRDCIRRRYPLIDFRMDRQDCIDYIRSVGQPVPPPSLCRRCHWKGPEELLWLWRNDLDAAAEWIVTEQNKLDTFADREGKNHGVYGTRRLLVEFVHAMHEHGQMTSAELDDWRFSHGHCIGTYM